MDRSYIGRIMRLALLAPDIVEAIVRGDEASGMSVIAGDFTSRTLTMIQAKPALRT